MTRPTTNLRIGGQCPAGSPTLRHGPGIGGIAPGATGADGHGHSHGGEHHHQHHHRVEQWRPHMPPGPNPVLDIGGDIGALVVYLTRLTASGELDIQPHGDPAGRFHTGVHRRDGVWVAVFPEVVEGRYELLDDHGHTRAQVVVTGGEVRELDLR